MAESNEPLASRLRKPLDTRQRQAIINARESAWLRGLHSVNLDAGRHPFVTAADSEAVEARFFEVLRQGVPYERSLTPSSLAGPAAQLAALPPAIAERAVVVFSPAEGVLGAFVTSCRDVMCRFEALAAYASYELCITTLDVAHGLSLERSNYAENGEYREDGVLLLRAWGELAPSD